MNVLLLALAIGLYEWRPAPEASDHQVLLYRDNTCVGGFNHKLGVFYKWADGKWSDPCPIPKDVPSPPIFGVDQGKLSTTSKFKLNDTEISREQAVELIEKGLPDDSKKLRLTVIDPDESRRSKILQDYEKTFTQAEKNNIIPMALPPDDWCLKDNVTGQLMFETSGNPTIYLQTSEGKVLHKQQGYNGPKDFQVIRRAVPGYDDRKTPDLRNNDLLPNVDPVTLMVVLGLGYFFYKEFYK